MRASALLLAGVLLASPASANSNRKGTWHTHATPHFRVVYHEEVKAQADFAKDFLEVAYAAQLKALGLRDKHVPITVVLTGHLDESNGYATPLGHKIVIWTRPGQAIASNDMAWLRRVLAHELGHQVTFLALRNQLGIYSELYKSTYMPAWFVEGLAQYLGEEWDAKRNTFFAHALRNEALEPYPCLASYTKQDPISGRLVYEQGHALVRFLAEQNGGSPFLGRLLKKVTVYPLWNELKALLSPLTSQSLPLEGAVRSLTGISMWEHYEDFLDSLRAGLPTEPGPLPESVVPGVEGLDAVLQARRLGDGDYLVAAQEKWDEPYVSLFHVRGGKPVGLGTGLVNPVFDLSPDGARLAYVKEYTDVDGEPTGRLRVRRLADGKEQDLGSGGYHPAFLSRDSLAFSRWKDGRQVLAFCALADGKARCREEAPDSLVGFYALSRSSRGLLMNATDDRGRTGIWEWSGSAGFQRILQDTVLAEFPVEAGDGGILFLRDIGGLMQLASLDRGTGAVTPLGTRPSGTFFLHRIAPGRIASVAQVRGKGRWHLAPVEPVLPVAEAGTAVAAPAGSPASGDAGSVTPTIPLADSSATARGAPDSAAVDSAGSSPAPSADPVAAAPDPAYRAPGFLDPPPLIPREYPQPPPGPPGRDYWSLLNVRPLILWPSLGITYQDGTLGAGALLQDPLEMHTLQGSLSASEDAVLYSLLYSNAQLPVEISLFADNTSLEIDSVETPVPGYEKVETITRSHTYEAMLAARPPMDLPAPHHVQLLLAGGAEVNEDRLGARASLEKETRLLDWSRIRSRAHFRSGIGWFRSYPYAYSAVHPLRESALTYSLLVRSPGDTYRQAELLWIHPLVDEITLTLLHARTDYAAEHRRLTFPLPDGTSVQYINRREQGASSYSYAALDLPLYKGYLGELPLLGICNFVGAGIFWALDTDEFEASPYSSRPALEGDRMVAGSRMYLLFHFLRRIPLVVSGYAQWDFEDEAAEFRASVDLGGVPSRVTGFRGASNAPSARSLRNRLLLPPSSP